MIQFAAHDLTHLLADYGYWAVLVFVMIESTGIPFPGETMLIAASICRFDPSVTHWAGCPGGSSRSDPGR